MADLRVLRERGLVRIRHTDLAGLRRAVASTGPGVTTWGESGAVEAVLRSAVENLGGGTIGAAAVVTFGLGPGARGIPAQVRRRRAAVVYGVSVERFRKYHERIVIEQVAEEILKLCEAQHLAGPSVAGCAELDRHIRMNGSLGGQCFPIIVHIEPVELLSDVDILVVPENVYLELQQHFKSSVSAAVRRAAAIRSADGGIVMDVISDELRAWVQAHGRTASLWRPER